MFIINITVNGAISPEQHESLFPLHVQWIKRYFSTGKFVIAGPYSDQERAGVIIAHAENRNELMTVLREDVYYPGLATYEIREFLPTTIAENLRQQKGA